MAERDYVVDKALRLWRSASQRAAAEQAERIALDRKLWPKEAKAADKLARHQAKHGRLATA